MGSEVVIGHRVAALIRLDEAERLRLLGGVFRPGSRSVMFRFSEVGELEDGDMFGAVIEAVEEQPDGLLRVQLMFWGDLAAVYVTPGSRFEVWYARTLGAGVVLPWSAGGAEGGADAGVGE
jgi:hypothetical protein